MEIKSHLKAYSTAALVGQTLQIHKILGLCVVSIGKLFEEHVSLIDEYG